MANSDDKKQLRCSFCGKSQEHVFMGRDFGHSRDFSDEIAAEIDKEVKKIATEINNFLNEENSDERKQI